MYLLFVQVLGVRCGGVGLCMSARMLEVCVCCFLVSAVSLFRLVVHIRACFVICVGRMLRWGCSF